MSSATLRSQPIVSRACSMVAPGMERVEPHLAVVVEVVDAEVGDDDAGSPAEPALLAPDPLALLGAAEVAGRRPEVDPLDEARLLWRMITNTSRALIAISQAPPLPGSRVFGCS